MPKLAFNFYEMNPWWRKYNFKSKNVPGNDANDSSQNKSNDRIDIVGKTINVTKFILLRRFWQCSIIWQQCKIVQVKH